MSFFENSVFFGVVISLLAYGAGSLLQNRFKLALFNPLLISVAATIAVLAAAGYRLRRVLFRRAVSELPAHAGDRVPRGAAL